VTASRRAPALRALILGLLSCGLADAQAQNVPAAAASASGNETEAIVLSPFSVTSASDTGYAAGDSLAASRFKTRLMDSASTVSVFTEQFLQDLGASSLAEVLEYGVNSNIDYDQNRPDPTMFYVDAGLQNTRINNRGLSGSSLTDFFRSRMPVDAYNTGRFDFASGPNSVLFGVANSAGSINTSTLQAELRKNHYKFSGQAGRWQDYRASVDSNFILVPQRVALRVLGVHARKDSWRAWDNREDNRVTGSLRVVPFKKAGTQIVASLEKANLSGMWSVPQNLADNVSFWETLPDSQRLVDNRGTAALNANLAAARGLERIAGNRHFIVTNSGDTYANTVGGVFGGLNLYTSTSFYETAAQFNTLVGVVPGWQPAIYRDTFQTLLPTSPAQASSNGPYQSNLVAPYHVGYGPDTTNASDVERLFLRLEQPVGKNLFLDVSYQKETATGSAFRLDTQISADPNLYIPDASGGVKPNPYVGRYYIDGAPLRTINTDDNEALRASALYNLDLKKFGDHKILAMWERSENTNSQLQGNQVLLNARTNAPIASADIRNANNRVDYRTYLTPGIDYRAWFAGTFSDTNLVRLNGIDYKKDFTDRSVSGNKSEAKTYVLASQSSFFDKKVFVSLGFRRDDYTTLTRVASLLAATDPRVTSGSRYAGDGILTDQYLPINDETFDTYTAGVVWHALPALSLFANQATNVAPAMTNRRVIANNFDVPSPVQGKGYDTGVMIRLLDNRFNARLTYFKGENPGNPVNRVNSVVVDHDRIVSALMTTNNPATGRPYLTQAEAFEKFVYQKSRGGTVGTYGGALLDGLSDDVTTGYEADLKFNPSRAWTFTGAFSYTKLERGNIFSEFDPWFASVRPYLERFGSPPGLVDQNNSPVNIAEHVERMQLAIDDVRNAGAFGFNNRPYKANMFTRYTFGAGQLRGVFAGGGVRWQSQNRTQRIVTGLSTAGRPIYGATLYGPEILEVDALLGYSGKMDFFGQRTTWRAQLNGYNVLNNREIQVLRYSADGTRLWRVTPRAPGSWRVSFSVDL
jgi:outer membrane receptor protein involved in Fe transport